MSRALVEPVILQNSWASANQIIPAFLYGTAWKRERTADLVYKALDSGFKGIDTACQPKHYQEHLVGQGLRKALKENGLKRENVFVQTKFTSVDGQDPNKIPYDANASIADQVRSSVQTSLENLRETEDAREASYIDSVVLHSPLRTFQATLEAWQTLERFVPHKIHSLGISNCPASTFYRLFEEASVKPAVVQNRFYPSTGFDVELRKFCRDNGVVYQSFWTLTANPKLVGSSMVTDAAKQIGISPASLFYAFVMELKNVVVLNGTTSHIIEDLDDLRKVGEFAANEPRVWEELVDRFRAVVGEID